MKKIKICSLFSGIGGFETGIFGAFGKENCEVVFASEIDKYASKSYEAIYGHKPNGDIRAVEAVDVPDHDVLVGGFPCQAFSIAGRREGFSDTTRGTLFFEIARIAKEKKPKLMVLENVKGLLNHDKGKTVEVIVSALSELGYAVDFEIVNSKRFGVPQNRERIFIVASRGAKREPWSLGGRSDAVAKVKGILSSIKGVQSFNFSFPKGEDSSIRLRDILEENPNPRYYMNEEKTAKLIEEVQRKGLAESASQNGLLMVGRLDMRGNDTIRRVYNPAGIAPTLTTMGGGHREPKIIVAGNVNPSGNGMNGQVYLDEGLSPTLTTNKGEGPKILTDKPRYRVRKLSPLECFRLQGFPESYLLTLREAGISDAQLYKVAGNAVTTNVISAIFKGLAPYIAEEKEAAAF